MTALHGQAGGARGSRTAACSVLARAAGRLRRLECDA
jgi:hypothetical protein